MERDYATVVLKESSYPLCVGFVSDKLINIVTNKGHFLQFRVPKSGGLCKVEAEHSIRSREEASNNT